MFTLTQEQIKEIVREFNYEIRYNYPELSFSDYVESYHLNNDCAAFSEYQKDLIAYEFLSTI